eukprot:6472890-Amphidinium_carterae.2
MHRSRAVAGADASHARIQMYERPTASKRLVLNMHHHRYIEQFIIRYTLPPMDVAHDRLYQKTLVFQGSLPAAASNAIIS